MLDSFLDACEQINENTTNMENPSNHAVWKKAVALSGLDFEWAKWIVLRTIYYDHIAKSTKPEDMEFKAGFMTNKAAMKIQERYNCEKKSSLLSCLMTSRPLTHPNGEKFTRSLPRTTMLLEGHDVIVSLEC